MSGRNPFKKFVNSADKGNDRKTCAERRLVKFGSFWMFPRERPGVGNKKYLVQVHCCVLVYGNF